MGPVFYGSGLVDEVDTENSMNECRVESLNTQVPNGKQRKPIYNLPSESWCVRRSLGEDHGIDGTRRSTA